LREADDRNVSSASYFLWSFQDNALPSETSNKSDNLTFTVSDKDGKKCRIIMRQGNDGRAGTKHSLYGHYGTNKGVITAEDVLRIPEVVSKGKRKPIKRGKNQLYEYTLSENGVKYIVTTEIKGKGELFTNFYTNRKPTVAEQGTQNTDEQRVQPQQSVSGAKLQKVSEPTRERPTFYSNADRAVDVEDD